MPDSYTPHLALVKPEIGASRDSWGAKLNANADTLDALVSQAMPVGAILDFAGPNAPPGWLICDGRLVSRVTYSTLFAVVGGYWGTGDGSTTFALPSTPGRALIGPGHIVDEVGVAADYTFTQRLGAQLRAIALANLPGWNMVSDAQGYHNHAGVTVGAGGHSHTTDTQGWHGHGMQGAGNHAHGGGTSGDGSHAHNITLPNQGAGVAAGAFNVMSNVFGNGNYVTDTQGFHGHSISTDVQGWHAHSIDGDGNHAHNVYGVGDHTHGIYADGSHQHNVWSGGGGQWFDLRQPVLVVTKIIYAGPQAATSLGALAAPLVQRLLAAPMRGSH